MPRVYVRVCGWLCSWRSKHVTVAVASGWCSWCFISPKILSAGPGYFKGLVEIEPMQRPRGRVQDFFGLMGKWWDAGRSMARCIGPTVSPQYSQHVVILVFINYLHDSLQFLQVCSFYILLAELHGFICHNVSVHWLQNALIEELQYIRQISTPRAQVIMLHRGRWPTGRFADLIPNVPSFGHCSSRSVSVPSTEFAARFPNHIAGLKRDAYFVKISISSKRPCWLDGRLSAFDGWT